MEFALVRLVHTLIFFVIFILQLQAAEDDVTPLAKPVAHNLASQLSEKDEKEKKISLFNLTPVVILSKFFSCLNYEGCCRLACCNRELRALWLNHPSWKIGSLNRMTDVRHSQDSAVIMEYSAKLFNFPQASVPIQREAARVLMNLISGAIPASVGERINAFTYLAERWMWGEFLLQTLNNRPFFFEMRRWAWELIRLPEISDQQRNHLILRSLMIDCYTGPAVQRLTWSDIHLHLVQFRNDSRTANEDKMFAELSIVRLRFAGVTGDLNNHYFNMSDSLAKVMSHAQTRPQDKDLASFYRGSLLISCYTVPGRLTLAQSVGFLQEAYNSRLLHAGIHKDIRDVLIRTRVFDRQGIPAQQAYEWATDFSQTLPTDAPHKAEMCVMRSSLKLMNSQLDPTYTDEMAYKDVCSYTEDPSVHPWVRSFARLVQGEFNYQGRIREPKLMDQDMYERFQRASEYLAIPGMRAKLMRVVMLTKTNVRDHVQTSRGLLTEVINSPYACFQDKTFARLLKADKQLRAIPSKEKDLKVYKEYESIAQAADALPESRKNARTKQALLKLTGRVEDETLTETAACQWVTDAGFNPKQKRQQLELLLRNDVLQAIRLFF